MRRTTSHSRRPVSGWTGWSRRSARSARCGVRERSRTAALPETTAYPRPQHDVPIIVGGSGERRTLEIAARLADGCNLPSALPVLEHKLEVLRAHCARAGRDPGEVMITVLDLPVIGRDRDEVAALVERLRGRRPAAAYASAHHAGTVDDHIGRYRLLAERGVTTVFVGLPDLSGPDEVERMQPDRRGVLPPSRDHGDLPIRQCDRGNRS